MPCGDVSGIVGEGVSDISDEEGFKDSGSAVPTPLYKFPVPSM